MEVVMERKIAKELLHLSHRAPALFMRYSQLQIYWDQNGFHRLSECGSGLWLPENITLRATAPQLPYFISRNMSFPIIRSSHATAIHPPLRSSEHGRPPLTALTKLGTRKSTVACSLHLGSTVRFPLAGRRSSSERIPDLVTKLCECGP